VTAGGRKGKSQKNAERKSNSKKKSYAKRGKSTPPEKSQGAIKGRRGGFGGKSDPLSERTAGLYLQPKVLGRLDPALGDRDALLGTRKKKREERQSESEQPAKRM